MQTNRFQPTKYGMFACIFLIHEPFNHEQFLHPTLCPFIETKSPNMYDWTDRQLSHQPLVKQNYL